MDINASTCIIQRSGPRGRRGDAPRCCFLAGAARLKKRRRTGRVHMASAECRSLRLAAWHDCCTPYTTTRGPLPNAGPMPAQLLPGVLQEVVRSGQEVVPHLPRSFPCQVCREPPHQHDADHGAFFTLACAEHPCLQCCALVAVVAV